MLKVPKTTAVFLLEISKNPVQKTQIKHKNKWRFGKKSHKVAQDQEQASEQASQVDSKSRACQLVSYQAKPSLAELSQAGPSETDQVKHRIPLHSKANRSKASQANQESQAKLASQQASQANQASEAKAKPRQVS